MIDIGIENNFIKNFLLIKNSEEQTEIGKCWLEGKCNIKDDDYIKEVSK